MVIGSEIQVEIEYPSQRQSSTGTIVVLQIYCNISRFGLLSYIKESGFGTTSHAYLTIQADRQFVEPVHKLLLNQSQTLMTTTMIDHQNNDAMAHY